VWSSWLCGTNTDSAAGQDASEAEVSDDAGIDKRQTTFVRGVQGERNVIAITKLQEKKQKRVARQEQVSNIRLFMYLN